MLIAYDARIPVSSETRAEKLKKKRLAHRLSSVHGRLKRYVRRDRQNDKTRQQQTKHDNKINANSLVSFGNDFVASLRAFLRACRCLIRPNCQCLNALGRERASVTACCARSGKSSNAALSVIQTQSSQIQVQSAQISLMHCERPWKVRPVRQIGSAV